MSMLYNFKDFLQIKYLTLAIKKLDKWIETKLKMN